MHAFSGACFFLPAEETKHNVKPLVCFYYTIMAEETNKTVLNASIAPENFDWEAFEGGDVYGGTDKGSIEEAYNKTLSKVVENEVVEGEVTAINKREVIVTIGGKSEGVISAPEFRYNPDLKVGDKVEVYVESAEDKKGQLVISHKKARALKSWDRVNEAYESGEIVKGFVKTRTKGGMIVDVFGIEAFLPGSQIDIKPIRDYDAYVNQSVIVVESSEERATQIFCSLSNRYDELRSISDSSSIRGSLTTKMIGDLLISPVLNSNLALWEQYSSNIVSEIEARLFESHHLTEVRDSILPRLMSGELNINEFSC